MDHGFNRNLHQILTYKLIGLELIFEPSISNLATTQYT